MPGSWELTNKDSNGIDVDAERSCFAPIRYANLASASAQDVFLAKRFEQMPKRIRFDYRCEQQEGSLTEDGHTQIVFPTFLHPLW